MRLEPRPYGGPPDLERIKAVSVEGWRVYPHATYPHPGDVDWWVYFGMQQDDLSQRITLWDDERGDTHGWVMLDPAGRFDMAVRPALMGSPCEEMIVEWAEAHFASQPGEGVTAYAAASERARTALLERRGYRGTPLFTCFSRPLNEALTAPALPAGFTFLDAMRPELVDFRAEVHYLAFHPSRMTADAYRQFMQAPGYDPTLDVVVVAPDGRHAAFAMCWADPATRVGLFEPVGTRPEFQRRGLGRASLLEGLRRLQDRGMARASVLCDADEPGTAAFYQSAGFEVTNTIFRYRRRIAKG